MKRFLVPGLLLVLAACSPSAGDAQPASTQPASAQAALAVHPVSGLEVIALKVEQGGKFHEFKVEVARSPAQQSRGMMFRTGMGADEGMLFPLQPPRLASFWMRNTVIPLDLIFIDFDGRIINIAANAVPYDETPLTSNRIAHAVLELNGGTAARLGIMPGARVRW